jgi:hypothetical protein
LPSYKGNLAIVSSFTKCGRSVYEDDVYDDDNEDEDDVAHQKYDSHIRKYICLFNLFS